MKEFFYKQLILLFSFFPLIFVGYTFAGTFEGYSGVDATVEISVCGDGAVEGPEECELTFPINQSCKDIGYDVGTLTCDASCSYIKTSCAYLPPKPILPPYPNIYDVPNAIIEPNIDIPVLPTFLTLYDVDSDGKLNKVEYCNGLSYWLKKWRIRILDEKSERDIDMIKLAKDTCDLNFDGNCDLIDLSIFLYTATNG